MGWFVLENTYVTRLGTLWTSGSEEPGQMGAQACAVPVLFVTAVAVTPLWTCLFLSPTLPLKEPLALALPFLSIWVQSSSQMEVSVCFSAHLPCLALASVCGHICPPLGLAYSWDGQLASAWD